MERFEGLAGDSLVAGVLHNPGAKHLAWQELLAEDGRFKSPAQLGELFRRRGVQPEQTAVTC